MTILKNQLLDGLVGFRSAGKAGTEPHAPGLFSYCALAHERLLAITLPLPLIGIVVSGAKEVWRDGAGERLTAGTMFALPADIELDIVNEPDERTHLYQSLILEIDPNQLPDLPLKPGALLAGDSRYAMPLTAERVEALLHATRAIVAGATGETVRAARLMELLALLQHEPAAQPLFAMSVAERTARLVRSTLTREWTAADVAARFAMSESTLRRRLAADGLSFSAILRRERMDAAQRLIGKGSGSGNAALAVGYASRAHFARAFRQTFGSNPARG